MRILVTGATGWVGSFLVPELLGAGHEVVGLARSDASAAALTGAGADVVRGTLDDLDALASAADGVAHLAFTHDVAFGGDFAAAVDTDRAAVDALGAALSGSGRPLVIASGLAGLPSGATLTEDTVSDGGQAGGRGATERAVLDLASSGVRSAAVRLAPTVHGAGDHGFVSVMVDAARRAGVSGYLGDGDDHWPAVHVTDAARLFRLALESAASGSVLHAVAEQAVPLRDVAESIGRELDLPVRRVEPEHFGRLAGFVGTDIRASSTLTRERTGWEPTGPTLLDDLAAGHYTRA